MNSLVNRANKQVAHIKNDLSNLRESLESNSFEISFSKVISQLSASLSGLQGTIRDLDTMARNETDQNRRDEYKEKVKLLQIDLGNFRSKFDQLKLEINEKEKLKNREELFKGRSTGKEEDISESNVTERLISQREDEILSNTNLRAQKSSLKSTRKRLFDATSSLGISQSLMKIIRQRSGQERAIFYIGCICTFLVIIILWKYF